MTQPLLAPRCCLNSSHRQQEESRRGKGMTLSRRTVLRNHAMLAFTAHRPDTELGLGKVVLIADGRVPSQTSVLASQRKGVNLWEKSLPRSLGVRAPSTTQVIGKITSHPLLKSHQHLLPNALNADSKFLPRSCLASPFLPLQSPSPLPVPPVA